MVHDGPDDAQRVHAAQFYVDNGRPSEAELQALRALEVSSDASIPETAAILDTLGTALLRQEKYADAEVHLARAYELAPDFKTPPFDQVREHYVQVLRANGREAEASAIEAGRNPVTPTPAPTPSAAPSSASSQTPPESDANVDGLAAVGEDVAD